MTRQRRSRQAALMAGVLLWLTGPAAQAKMDPTNVSININGTVVANASCTFSGSRPLKVEFGDVYINELRPGAYRQPLSYTLVCRGDPDGKAVQLRFSGSGASFDGRLLKTDAPGLGIELLSNGTQQQMNDWFTINPDSPPRLAAELVKQEGASFRNGQEFNAWALLVVAYN